VVCIEDSIKRRVNAYISMESRSLKIIYIFMTYHITFVFLWIPENVTLRDTF
jgi:hypothetical protein